MIYFMARGCSDEDSPRKRAERIDVDRNWMPATFALESGAGICVCFHLYLELPRNWKSCTYWSQEGLGWLTWFQPVTIIGRQGLDTVVERLEQLHLICLVEVLEGRGCGIELVLASS